MNIHSKGKQILSLRLSDSLCPRLFSTLSILRDNAFGLVIIAIGIGKLAEELEKMHNKSFKSDAT